jgi:folate-binding protein YgfZ
MSGQRSPLYDATLSSGAGFLEAFGWELPRSYGDPAAEYFAARDGVALHDSSYVGRIKATGEDVLDLLHRISTNDLLSLQPGHGAPTVLTTDRGRILDLLAVLNLGDQILLLTGPNTRDTVIEWIDKYTFVEDITLEDVTATTVMLSAMGPNSHSLLRELAGVELGPNRSTPAAIAGVEARVIRRDLVDQPRYEIVVARQDSEPVWKELTAAGAIPIGLEAYEALRVEAGEPSSDRELGEAYNPLETGLWGSISFTKGCYIGQEVIARLDTYQKVQKHLVSFVFSPGARVNEGVRLSKDGKDVGQVTSVAVLPSTGEAIGMGYVRKEAADVGTQMDLDGQTGAWARVESLLQPLGPGAGYISSE